MENVKELLTNALNPQARLMAETRGLMSKWEKTGLLEGLKNDIEKSNMAVLLENQAKQLIEESSVTGTQGNSEQWAGVALPLVRRVFAEIAAKEFVSVQPMNLPSGLVFYLDFKYGTTSGAFTADSSTNYSSLFGGTGAKSGSTDQPTGGLYGPGRFGYTVNDQNVWQNPTASLATIADINFDTGNSNDPVNQGLSASLSSSQLFTLTTGNLTAITLANSGSFPDMNAVRSFVPTGSAGIVTYFPGFTRVNGSEVVFVVSASSAAALTASAFRVNLSLQPKDTSRGDFEDRLGASTATDTGLNKDIGIPEVNLELRSEPIVAKTRKLKAVWTPELAQDLNAYHSVDAEAELTALLSEYVSMEIDLEILDMLITNAPAINKERWSAKLNREIIKTGASSYQIVDQTTAGSGGYYTKATWYQTLGNKIQKVSNKIHQLTLRGGANFMVVGPDVATILESIPGFVVNTDGDSAKFAMGVSRVGSFASRFQVYKNPYMQENLILLGFRGNNFLETGAVYSPYIPLIQTPLVYDPVNFTPRRGVMTRYAKKIVRPEFYGLIYVADTNQV
jgi:major capsid protein Gp23